MPAQIVGLSQDEAVREDIRFVGTLGAPIELRRQVAELGLRHARLWLLDDLVALGLVLQRENFKLISDGSMLKWLVR